MIEMIVDAGVNGGELLKTSHSPEPEHGPLSSSQRQVAVLGPIIEPLPDFLVAFIADGFHGRSIGLELVRDNRHWLAISLHRLTQKLQCCLAIPAFGDKRHEHFSFMIDGPPTIVGLAIYLDEHLVQMPLPLEPSSPSVVSLPTDLGGEYWSDPVPPEPDRLMANVYAALMKQVLDVPQRKRKSHIHHHRETNDFRRCLEIPKWILAHAANLTANPLTGFLLTGPSGALGGGLAACLIASPLMSIVQEVMALRGGLPIFGSARGV